MNGTGWGGGAHLGPHRSPLSRLMAATGKEGHKKPGLLADQPLSNPTQGISSSMWQGPHLTQAPLHVQGLASQTAQLNKQKQEDTQFTLNSRKAMHQF